MGDIVSKATKVAIPAALAFGVYKFVQNPAIKTAALSVLALVIAKQLPIVGDAL